MYKSVTEGIETSPVPEEQRLSSADGNKAAATPDSREITQPSKDGILNHKVLSDEELVVKIVGTQDEEAFNEIVNRYADKIFRLALRITHDPRDAEDIMQEVFLTMEKLDTFRGESKFSTWLYRVAANAGYMSLRAKKRIYENEVSLEDHVSYNEYGVLEGVRIKDWSGRPDEVLFRKEVMETIEKALNELPAAHRVVFHLRDVEGLSNREVADILNLSLPNVKSRIRRARLFLRDKLSDYFFMSGKDDLYPSCHEGL